MPSTSSILSFTALLALARAHGVVLGAQGLAGSPTSVGFQVDPNLARNCTTINPCQQDATIIRNAEITANIVNECGRTEISGNIDIGENTENALAANAVTQVQAGTKMTVTIHQVNADGAGPYSCDLVEAGNNGIITQNLTVENNVPGANGFSQAKAQQFNMTVIMPQTFACTGSSAGNVCTVRCRNNAQAGPFGGCFPVQQVDVTPSANTPANIPTIQQLDKVLAQVNQNKQDLNAAVAANQVAGSDAGKANQAAADKALGLKVISKAAPVQTLEVALGGNAAAGGAAATSTAAAAGSAAATTTAKAGKAAKASTAAAAATSGATTKKNKNTQRSLRAKRRNVVAGRD